MSDSDLEIYFRRIVRAAKLPMPLSKQHINDFEVDFSGQSWDWSSRRTGSATTALPLPKRATPDATASVTAPDLEHSPLCPKSAAPS